MSKIRAVNLLQAVSISTHSEQAIFLRPEKC